MGKEYKGSSQEYMDRAHRIMDMENDGALTHEQSSRIRKGMGLMYARRKARGK